MRDISIMRVVMLINERIKDPFNFVFVQFPLVQQRSYVVAAVAGRGAGAGAGAAVAAVVAVVIVRNCKKTTIHFDVV